jgi:hypothetical protein
MSSPLLLELVNWRACFKIAPSVMLLTGVLYCKFLSNTRVLTRGVWAHHDDQRTLGWGLHGRQALAVRRTEPGLG